MDYQPQTMTVSEMDAELANMLAAAKDILQSVEATTADTLSILDQIESKVISLSGEMTTDMEALDAVEAEAEEAFDTLLLEQAVDIAE